jgi:hypothetical protein
MVKQTPFMCPQCDNPTKLTHTAIYTPKAGAFVDRDRRCLFCKFKFRTRESVYLGDSTIDHPPKRGSLPASLSEELDEERRQAEEDARLAALINSAETVEPQNEIPAVTLHPHAQQPGETKEEHASRMRAIFPNWDL